MEGQEGTSQEVVLELRLEDEAESSGWGWVGRDRASHREVHEQQHKDSRAGEDSVAEQLEEGKDAAECRDMSLGACTEFYKPRPSLWT